MSERTISPGMDHMNRLPLRNILDTGSTFPTAEHNGSVKRKWSPDHSNSSTGTLISQHETLRETGTASPNDSESPRDYKRAKVADSSLAQDGSAVAVRCMPSDRSQLPAEMWQYIFTCLPPYSLGRLMCVKKVFNTLLAPDRIPPAPQLAAHGPLKLIDPEHLWSLSRRAFFPGMPRPLSARSELGMWKLVRGNGCEFCGKTNASTIPPVSTSPWAAGPGNDYVRMIWPFSVRSCGNCLRTRLQKETDLLFSSSSALLPALPFAFFTPSLNYVASITLRNDPPPTGLQLTKSYFGPQVNEMKAKLDEVRDLGAATAEEWFKGLEVDGREKSADTARWEHWESAGGFKVIAHSISQIQHLQMPNHEQQHHFSAVSQKQSSSVPQKQSSSVPGTATIQDFTHSRPTINAHAYPWAIQAPPSTLPPKPATPLSPYGVAYQGIVPNFSMQALKPHTRVERSIHDVNEKKTARRAEIERRCAELDPPIKPSTLALMDSFAAALQIAMPLTGQAWELLQPRLLAQREAAEQQEREQLAQNQFLMQQTEERKQQETQLREAKENLDREWEESQSSIREKLNTYADNFIREQWQNGDAVTKSSCAQFAADMLLHVRHRFYTSLAQEDARMRAMGIPIPTDSPHAAPTRKLTLENMRWVYENKIKPLTEHLQKELFLCNACDNHGRYYSLDSVVQHFAAKHTDSLSMGTTVVYWKADWPELPPFDPNPTAAKASMYASANPSPALPPGQFMHAASEAYHGYSAGAQVTLNQSMFPPSQSVQHTVHGPSQGFGSASPGYQERTSPRNTFHQAGQTASQSYNPAPTFTYPTAPGYGFSQFPDHHDWQRQQGPNNAINLYQQHFPASYQSQQQDFDARPGSTLSYVSHNPSYLGMPSALNQFSRSQPQAGVRPGFHPVPPGQPMGIYQVQIQELANNARDVWNGTSGISDMPDSVRVQVIIRHVVLRFKDKYTNEPSLALFTDGLTNNSQLSPMRSLSGLPCKACATEIRMNGTHGNDDVRDPERRMHTLPALLAHFQSAHVEHVQPIAISSSGIEMPRLDWKFDMIEMPDANIVRDLIYSRGITQTKLNLIATVLPSYFPLPLPQVDLKPHHDNHDTAVAGSGPRKTPQDSDAYKSDAHAIQTPFEDSISTTSHFQHLPMVARHGDSQRSPYRFGDRPDVLRPNEASREDEYDPHRPAYVNAKESEGRSGLVSDRYGHQSRQEHEEVSPHSFITDHHARRNVEAIIDNNGTAATAQHADLSTNPHPSGRSDVEAQELSTRNASIQETQARWAVQNSRPLQAERKITPMREPLNAAEQFLRSFDLTSDALQQPTHPTLAVGTSKRDEYGHEVGGGTDFPLNVDDSSWLSNRLNTRTVDYSRKSSPSHTVPAEGRYITGDDGIVEPHQSHEYDRFYGGRLADPQSRTQRSRAASPDNQTLSRARPSHLPAHLKTVRGSPSRRPNSRFDRYEAQRHGSQRAQTHSPATASEALPADDAFHRDVYSVHQPAGRQIYAAQAEEPYQNYPYTDEIMYRRAPQSSQQIRYVENPRYLEPINNRYVEYVRVAPRDSQTSGGYYVQRPAPHHRADEYVGYEPTRAHEQVFEQEGHLYTRAPQPSDDYGDPDARQMTYQ